MLRFDRGDIGHLGHLGDHYAQLATVLDLRVIGTSCAPEDGMRTKSGLGKALSARAASNSMNPRAMPRAHSACAPLFTQP
jgi:hypothetical protein